MLMLHGATEIISINASGTSFRFKKGKPKNYLSRLPISESIFE